MHLLVCHVSLILKNLITLQMFFKYSLALIFSLDERNKNFDIEILYNKQRSWAVTFTVILGPDDVSNANIGNISKAIVRVASVLNTESLILPSVPIVSISYSSIV